MPAHQAVQQREDDERRQQVRQQPFAVAPQPVDLPRGDAPSVALPALQGDARHPPAALPHRRAEIPREVLARGHRAGRTAPHRQEHLAAAQLVQGEPGFIVLGEAFGVEHAAAARGRQAVHGVAPEARPHAGGRQESAQALARLKLLGLALGELVAVHPVGHFPHARGQRQDGNLHHIVLAGEPVHQAQGFGVDDVLGVVHHEDLEPHAVLRLVPDHAAVDPVQAVALGGGSTVRAAGHVDPRMAARRALHRADGQFVVGVDSGEDVVIAIADGGEIAVEHLADDGVLVPQRHEDGDGAFGGLLQGGFLGPGEGLARGDQPDQGDKQVVQPAQQDPQRQRRQTADNPAIQPHDKGHPTAGREIRAGCRTPSTRPNEDCGPAARTFSCIGRHLPPDSRRFLRGRSGGARRGVRAGG